MVGGLVAAGALVGLVPTLDRRLLGAPPSAETVIVGALAVAAFGLLVVAATELEAFVARRSADRGDVAAGTGTAAKYLLVFLALVGVYTPVTRALYPFLRGTDAAGLLDLGYTVAALALPAAVGVVAYRNLDGLAALAAAHLDSADVEGSVASDADGSRTPSRGDSRGN